MDNVNWKVLSLLTVTLLVALALQAGAIKIMINLARQPDAPAAVAAGAGAVPGKPAVASAPPHRPAAPEERTVSEPASPAREPKPAALVADPPHLAGLAPKPEPSRGEPSPEAHQAPVPAAGVPARPSAEAALVAAEAKPQPAVADSPAHSPAPSAPSAEVAAAPTAPAAGSELQEPDWLKARNPKHYTVQLYSGKDIDTLREIAAAAASTEPQAYYSTGSRSGPWYSLVTGDYPDSASAQAAAAKLSVRSPALKPWVRRFDEIQAKIR